MGVIYKKMKRKNLRNPDKPKLFHPQLVTLGQTKDLNQIAYEMKEKSSLSKGDILSVLSNFMDAMRGSLYNGYSVNIRDFGVFSLSARTEGVETEKECTAKCIKTVRINFRPSTSVRPDLAATRAGDRIDFVDLQTYQGKDAPGGDGGGGDIIDPMG